MSGTTSSGFTVWFTGMAGAGKSTLAQALAHRLRRLGQSPEVLDGPEVEQHLRVGKAQTKDERNEEARRLAWVCKLVTRGGGVVIQSAIESPYRETRDEARRQIHRFCEVFVECPIETLIARDRTGVYKRALAGEIKNLPGISEPYEPPTHAEVIVDTSKQSVDEAVEHLLGQLVALRLLDPSTAGLRGRPRVSVRSNKKPAPLLPLSPPPADKPAVRPPPLKPARTLKPARKVPARTAPLSRKDKRGKPSARARVKLARAARPAARTARAPQHVR